MEVVPVDKKTSSRNDRTKENHFKMYFQFSQISHIMHFYACRQATVGKIPIKNPADDRNNVHKTNLISPSYVYN